MGWSLVTLQRVRQSETCIRESSRKKWIQAKIRIPNKKTATGKDTENETLLGSIPLLATMYPQILAEILKSVRQVLSP